MAISRNEILFLNSKNRYETTDASTYYLLLEHARRMRNNPTEAEKILWKYLASNRMGVHFRQQHPIHGYIPDFVCLKQKLIIELDGGYHLVGEQPQMDKERTEWLSKEGYRVIRFTNEDVFNRLDEVLDKIAEELENASK